MHSLRHTQTIRHRLPAAIALVPIAAMAWLLIFNVPVGRRPFWRLNDEVTQDGNSVVRTERLNWQKRRVGIDLDTGLSTISDYGTESDYVGTYERVNARGDSIRIGTDPPFSVVRIVDRQGKVTVDTRLDGYFTLVGDDYLVGVVNEQFEIRDIRNVHNVVFSPTAFQDFSNTDIVAVGGLDRFIRRVLTPKGVFLELYEVADGKALLLTQWPAENDNAACRDGKIFNWKSTGATGSSQPVATNRTPTKWAIEVHDASGHLLETLELPPPFDSGAIKCKIIQDRVRFVDSASNSIRHFDLQWRQEIAPNTRYIGDRSPGNRSLVHFVGTYNLTIDQFEPPFVLSTYDRTSGKLTSSLEIGVPFEMLGHSRSGNLLLASSAHGYSVIEVASDGSEVVRTQAPYAWAGWLMPLTAVLFAAWAVYWVRCSARDKGWAWIDCMLIGGLPLVSTWQRSLAVESEHLVFGYQLGIYIGLLSVATTWLALGQTRSSLRFLVVAGIVSLGLRFGLAVARAEQIAFPVVTLSIGTTLALLCVARCARFCGVKLTNSRLAQERAPPARATIGGFFWVTLGIAVLAMEYRSLSRIPIVGSSGEIAALLLFSGCCGLLMLAAVAIALKRGRILPTCTGVSCAAIVSTAVALPWSMFVYGWKPIVPNWMLSPALLTLPFAATFILLLPYRLRGWRIAWRSDRSALSRATRH